MKGKTVDSWEAKADKAIARHARERAKAMTTEYGDGLSLHPERDFPNGPWLEWRFRFTDASGHQRCIRLWQWPQIGEAEAREMAKSLRAGDARTVGRVMLRYNKLGLSESLMIQGMGEAGLKASIEIQNVWLRGISRESHWTRLEMAENRRPLRRLESLLRKVHAFARVRGIQLQTAAGETRVAA